MPSDELLLFLLFSICRGALRESESVCTGYWQCFDTRLRRNGIWWLAYWKSILSRHHTTSPSTLLRIKFRLLNIDGRSVRVQGSASEREKLYHLMLTRSLFALVMPNGWMEQL